MSRSATTPLTTKIGETTTRATTSREIYLAFDFYERLDDNFRGDDWSEIDESYIAGDIGAGSKNHQGKGSDDLYIRFFATVASERAVHRSSVFSPLVRGLRMDSPVEWNRLSLGLAEHKLTRIFHIGM